MTEKDALRRAMKDQRLAMGSTRRATLSVALCEAVRGWETYRRARTVMLYSPIGGELNPMPLCWDAHKCFALPRMTGPIAMEAARYARGDVLRPGCYGFSAPTGLALPPEDLDLILVPALACDAFGTRLGYGRGCYDRFLSGLRLRAITAAVVYDESFLDRVPAEPWDVPMDYIVTPSNIYTKMEVPHETV